VCSLSSLPRARFYHWRGGRSAAGPSHYQKGTPASWSALPSRERKGYQGRSPWLVTNTLSTAPHQFEPILQHKPNGEVDAGPWCLGFHAAMQPRLSAWAPLLDTRNINHSLLPPILLHCVDDHGHRMIGPPRKVPKTEEFLRHARNDIPAVVEAMRQYWMPTRYAHAGRLLSTWMLMPVTLERLRFRFEQLGQLPPAVSGDARRALLDVHLLTVRHA
jgi:hypothetical protein